MSGTLCVCERCSQAKPLFLYRLAFPHKVQERGGHTVRCPSAALCEQCAWLLNAKPWFVRSTVAA